MDPTDKEKREARIQAITEQQRLFGDAMLPEICLNLRASMNGAADPWPKEDVEQAMAMLRRRLATWDDNASITVCRRLDEAIKRVVEATVDEVAYYQREELFWEISHANNK